MILPSLYSLGDIIHIVPCPLSMTSSPVCVPNRRIHRHRCREQGPGPQKPTAKWLRPELRSISRLQKINGVILCTYITRHACVGISNHDNGALALTLQALGGRRRATHEALGDIKLPPYLSRNISAMRKHRNAKLCTHLPKYLAEVMCKFGANPMSDDVTEISEVKL